MHCIYYPVFDFNMLCILFNLQLRGGVWFFPHVWEICVPSPCSYVHLQSVLGDQLLKSRKTKVSNKRFPICTSDFKLFVSTTTLYKQNNPDKNHKEYLLWKAPFTDTYSLELCGGSVLWHNTLVFLHTSKTHHQKQAETTLLFHSHPAPRVPPLFIYNCLKSRGIKMSLQHLPKSKTHSRNWENWAIEYIQNSNCHQKRKWSLLLVATETL